MKVEHNIWIEIKTWIANGLTDEEIVARLKVRHNIIMSVEELLELLKKDMEADK